MYDIENLYFAPKFYVIFRFQFTKNSNRAQIILKNLKNNINVHLTFV